MSRALYEKLIRLGVSAQRVASLKAGGASLAEIQARFAHRPLAEPASDPFWTPACAAYPAPLKTLRDKPLQVFHRGLPWEKLSPFIVGIVGSRQATSYGITSARRLGAALARGGVTVCSGLARGIDAAAHWGVLEELQRNPGAAAPVGVLGHGWGVMHPPENIKLFQEVLHHGVLLTEYPRGFPPSKWTFPARNRIIAALCNVVVVVEAGARSGSLHTANFAGELGKDVWAVPASPGKPNSLGVLKLIKDGAGMVTDFDEFVHEIVPRKTSKSPSVKRLDPDTALLLKHLARSEGRIDPVCEALDWSPTELAYRLTELELEGLIVRNLDGQWDLLCWDLLGDLA